MKKIIILFACLLVVIPSLAYNPNFERKYNDALAKYEQGQYDSAKKVISGALKTLPNLSTEQKDKGDRLLALCNQKIANQNRLNLSTKEVTLTYASHLDSVGVDAGKPQLLSSSSSAPGWCIVDGIRDGFLYFHTEFNEKKIPREADITVKMGKIRPQKVHIVQEARPETTKKVVIRTSPDRAWISVDGEEAYVGTWEGTLASGAHRVHIEKGSYAARDTVITVLDDMHREDTLAYRIHLSPNFAKLDLHIMPEPGFSIDSGAILKVNGVTISDTSFTYDDERDEPRYLTRYPDGTIPVHAGTVDIEVIAEHFTPFKKQIRLVRAETYKDSVRLSPITGFLTLGDGGNAAQARVIFDGKDIGAIEDIVAFRTLVGSHKITVKKEGYQSSEVFYPVTITEDNSSFVTVSMDRCVSYVFKSTPSGAQVFIDGEFVGVTPTPAHVLQEFEQKHTFNVEYKKRGFLPVSRKIQPNYILKEAVDSVQLLEASPFFLEADEDKLTVSIEDKEKKAVYYEKTELPAEIVLPISATPYKITAWRRGKKSPAYRGTLKFDNPEKNHRKIKAWPKNNLLVISGEYSFLPYKLSLVDSPEEARFARVNLCSFRLLPGLSTSAVRGLAFFNSTFEHFAPAISFAFINGDFRLGGSISDYVDVNSLISYAWYPPIFAWNFLKDAFVIPNLAGHDVFIGFEVTPRIPIANITLKAGYQMFPGMEQYVPSASNSTYEGKKNDYTIQAFPINNQFVVSITVALTFSTKNKGNNIWRLF